jgi:agmatinase
MHDSFPQSPFASPKGGYPFAGIATFAGYPWWQPGQSVDAVFLGVPYDEGTTYRPGARFGPRAIRDASMFYNYETQQDRFYDADRREWIMPGKLIADAGDVQIEPLSLHKNWEAITRAVKMVLSSGAVPAVAGGDHSITHPIVQALEGRKFHYVHFDTHADCAEGSDHGTPLLHILQSGLAESVTIIGVRGLTNWAHELNWAQERGATIITARELRAQLQQSVSHSFPTGDYYLSLDIDFFDPSLAPGTGTPEPGGLFFHEFSELVHTIAAVANIIGFDVVEVNPLLDGPGAITQHLAARCVLELMGAALA